MTALVVSGCASKQTVPVSSVALPGLATTFSYTGSVLVRDLSGEILLKTPNENMFADMHTYHAHSSGAGDWTLSPKAFSAVKTSGTCDALKQSSVYLPVKTTTPLLCHVMVRDPSHVIVTMVGEGQPDDALDFLQSAIVVLEPKAYLTILGLTPFPTSEQYIEALTDAYPTTHPKLPAPQWPNTGFHFLAIDVRAYLQTQLVPPSADVLKNDAAVQAIARTLTFTADGSLSSRAP